MPPLVIALIALPALGIVGLVGYYLLSDRGEEVVVKDENAEINQLIKEVSSLEKRGSAALKALRAEEHGADGKAEVFMEKAQDWMDEWEKLTVDLRDKKGRWKPKYAGYEEHRKRVNTILYDVQRGMGF